MTKLWNLGEWAYLTAMNEAEAKGVRFPNNPIALSMPTIRSPKSLHISVLLEIN